MSDPIPLEHAGVVRAWMCGVCLRVHAYDTGSDHLRDPDEVVPATEWQEERTVGGWHAYKVERFDRSEAEMCCRCRDCGCDLPIPRDDQWRPCLRCRWLDAWSRLIGEVCKDIATRALPVRRTPTPVVPLPPDDAWHQGGDGGQGHPTWPIVAAMSELSEDAYCATWMNGAEYTIWDLGESTGGSWGNCDDAADRARSIVRDAKALGVWWYYRSPIESADQLDPIRYDPYDYRGPWPVTLATWKKMRAAARLVRRG